MSPIKIGGIEKFSIVDFPNKMAAVVFMPGCPWRCPFCHNVQLQSIDTETNIVWHKFIDFLEQRKGILDAVVFSGGEPLVQEGLIDAIKDVKSLGYIVGLHTGGYRPEFFTEVLESLKLLCESGKSFECRTTCDPRFLSVDDIYTIGNKLKEMGVKEYYLQKYRIVESDLENTEDRCLALVENEELNAYLKENFEIFDVRK